MSRWQDVALLSAGGVLGVNARHWMALGLSRWVNPQFPWATFTINVTGSLAIGFATTILARWLPTPAARLFLVVGFLGGYTTFSSFALEGHALWTRGEPARALAYLGGSVVAGFLAVVVGIGLAHLAIGPEATAIAVASESIEGVDE